MHTNKTLTCDDLSGLFTVLPVRYKHLSPMIAANRWVYITMVCCALAVSPLAVCASVMASVTTKCKH